MREQPLQLSYQRFRQIIFILSIHIVSFGQTPISIVEENGDPLIGALLSIPQHNLNLSSSLDGQVVLPEYIERTDSVHVSFISFQTQKLSFQNVLDLNKLIVLAPLASQLDDIILVGRNEKYKADVLLPVDIIDQAEIQFLQAQTPADLLEKNGTVFVQKSQMGGGSPVIRGFEANKILLVVDGVRLNNAIYRNGHLQSSITLDEQALESVEILFGPGSISYGSEAIGGVVHYRTKTPKLSVDPKNKVNAMTRFSSANLEKSVNLNYEFTSAKFAALVTGTISDFDNLRAGGNYPDKYPDFGKRPDYILYSDDPQDELSNELVVNDNPNVQVGTKYSQQDLSGKLKYQVNDQIGIVFNAQYSNSSNIPRFDRLAEREGDSLTFAEWYYGPQKRLLFSLNTSLSFSTPLYDNIQFIAAYQKIKEDRISRILGSTERESNFEDLSVYSLTVDFNKQLSSRFRLSYGIDVQQNELQSTASENIFTRYPNGANQMNLFGAYAKATYDISKNWTWDGGLRYSSSQINLNYNRDEFFDWPDYFYNGIENTSSNISYLTSIGYHKNKFKAVLLGGTAFRAPNIDDLAKIRVKADEITIPNPDLKPETTINGELQIQYGSKESNLSFSVFAVELNNAIIRDAFTLIDGSGVYINNGNSLMVTANINAESATVTGTSIGGRHRFSKSFSADGSISLTKGVQSISGSTETSPLGHIPPIFGKLSVNYDSNDFRHQVSLRFNGRKKLEDFGGSVDNPELATPEGALAWHTLNYHLFISKFKYFDLQLGVENILDRHYRPFSSGLSASGRNFIITLRTKF